MVDLHFADKKDKKIHDCNQCPESQKRTRKCQEKGFNNNGRPRWKVDDMGRMYTFCPAKATWYPEVVQTYRECKLAFYTGILPKEGSFHDQSEMFVDCFPAFVDHYTERKYGRVWQDVNNFANEILKTVRKWFGGK